MEFTADLFNLRRILEYICQSAESKGLGPVEVKKLELAAEEAIVNIINHAYPLEGMKPLIQIECKKENSNRITVTIKDQGIAFNPLTYKAASVVLSPEQRKVGGLGIILMKKLISEISYERQGHTNSLKFTFVLD